MATTKKPTKKKVTAKKVVKKKSTPKKRVVKKVAPKKRVAKKVAPKKSFSIKTRTGLQKELKALGVKLPHGYGVEKRTPRKKKK